jgi:hypothetical protein
MVGMIAVCQLGRLACVALRRTWRLYRVRQMIVEIERGRLAEIHRAARIERARGRFLPLRRGGSSEDQP